MADEIDRKLLDKRVAQRYLKKGVLDEKEYEKHLKSLPDLEQQALPLDADLEAPNALDLDDDDEDMDEVEGEGGGEEPKGA
jgi:hypothetical protein